MLNQGNAALPVSASTAMTFTGPFATGQALTVLSHLTGKLVTVEIPSLAAAGAAVAGAASDTALPVGMRPQATVTGTVSIVSNSVNIPAAGKISIATTGVITIYCSILQSTTFSAIGNNGWDRITVSFLTA